MTIKYTLTTVNTRVLHNYGDRHAASISAAISHATQLLGYVSCVTVKSKQSERLLSESWAAWATKHMTFRGRSF